MPHSLGASKRLQYAVAAIVFMLMIYTAAFKPPQGAIHYTNKVAVLEYHDINPQESTYTISPQRFSEQLQALKKNDYHVISMSDFIAFLQGRMKVLPNAVVITFDDGYESFYTYAYPLLTKESMTATGFLIVGRIGTKNTYLTYLNWQQAQEMNRNGFNFYSHTYNSHDFVLGRNNKLVDPLTKPIYLTESKRMETRAEYETRVSNDLAKANAVLSIKLKNSLAMLCLPHGHYTNELLQLAEKAGMNFIFTGNDGLNSPGDTLIKRIDAGNPRDTAAKLIRKLNEEPTLFGKLRAKLKNFIISTQ